MVSTTDKVVLYQIFTRTFGNKNLTRKENGSYAENGAGKMNDIDAQVLRQVRRLGITHVWYTGIIRHATTTDYSCYGIPKQHPAVVKGKAGSPYAIVDYYDVDPDLAVEVPQRMEEFRSLVSRTHAEGLKVVIDFVPNHVAREYKSVNKPSGVFDLGEEDDARSHFSAQNNFYYCPGEHFEPCFDKGDYEEFPAKCTGNDHFDSHPRMNDWYETIKLNYGIDYTGGGARHFNPVPPTWKKMVDILLFWSAMGVDGFRCDMVEMVPTEFWAYAAQRLRTEYPEIILIGEVYNPGLYRDYLAAGFDYLYDKVGMYDTVRGVMCGWCPAGNITGQWQATNDIQDHMLYFLENHDEQRIASDYFCGDARKGVPGLIVSALLRTNPVMIYAGQEFGERGMDKEGFSGCDGRSTIFDYWTVDAVYRGYFERAALTESARQLESVYSQILNLARKEKAFREGEMFDLMYANGANGDFNPHRQFAFLRKKDDELVLVVANFSAEKASLRVVIPSHAFDFFGIEEGTRTGEELLSGCVRTNDWKRDGHIPVEVDGYSGAIIKCKV